MSNSLLPERSIQFSPSLATAIGIECAILLQHLQLLAETTGLPAASGEPNQRLVLTSYKKLSAQLPFWNINTLRRVLHELSELGMLALSGHASEADEDFQVALATGHVEQASPAAATDAPNTATLSGASKMTQHWTPEPAALEMLAHNGIPREFVASLIPEFTFYWRERNEASHAWSSKFVQHASRRWQQQQHTQAGTVGSSAEAINKSWQPSEDALEILERMGINRNFIVDAIPEFVLYWRERNEPVGTWNSKFVAHTKRQWARFTHTLKNDTEPSTITKDWQPDADVMEVIALANIEASFAKALIPEFVVYWKERGDLHHSWGTKFLQYVKQKWSYNHSHSNRNHQSPHERHRSSTATGKTRDRSLSEDLLDRSWAN